MTNAEIIATIRNEIERLKKNENDLIENSTKKYGAYPASSDIMLIAYQNVLSFIDTLVPEKPMNQDEELNEEIKKEMVKLPFFIRGKDQIAFARHFVKWGAEHSGSSEIPNDLQEYASRAGFDYVDDIEVENPGHRWNDHDVEYAYRDGIIAGAKWQAEQLLKGSPLPEDTVLFNKGVAEGKRLMMEEAVEGEVVQDLKGVNRVKSFGKIPEWLHFGDKVRIIILPKED